MITHIDLFSGIGGLSLALDNVYGKENTQHTFCEIDPFCRAVLKKHWPEAKIHSDIRSLTNADSGRRVHRKPKKLSAKAEQQAQRESLAGSGGLDLVTGGFPCQPFSIAGRKKGKADDRYLWPEMLRIIRETQPTWVVGENVAGIIGMVQPIDGIPVEGEDAPGGDEEGTSHSAGILRGIIADLENLNYATDTLVIPACAVGAPHRRDRVWIVAHASTAGAECERGEVANERGRASKDRPEGVRQTYGPIGTSWTTTTGGDAPNAKSIGGRGRSGGKHGTSGRKFLSEKQRRNPARSEGAGRSWDDNWLEVATRLCGVDDGLPAGVDGLKLSKSAHRRERLKALGNAIVPQVAMEIFRAIKHEHI